MDNDGARSLITRGNLDGIVSAAVFLNRYPGSSVTFTTSPTSAARALSAERAREVYVVDHSLTPDLVHAVEAALADRAVTVVDHHPCTSPPPFAIIDDRTSAAGLLYHFLDGRGLDGVVALADLYEMTSTQLLGRVTDAFGLERLEQEATVLDFAWRWNVEDDLFRQTAAALLAQGGLPSSHHAILERYRSVVRKGGWAGALETARKRMVVRDGVAILDLRKKRASLNGFGSRALSEVARQEGCRYAAMLNRSREGTAVSLRSLGGQADLGTFVEDFTAEHGFGGGGHPNAAGARIPSAAAPLLLDELACLAA